MDNEIVENYSGMVYRIAYGYVKNKYDAEDVTSEVFLRYFRRPRFFVNNEHTKAWLIKVTINCSKDNIKSNSAYVGLSEIDAEALRSDTEEWFIDKTDIHMCLSKLDETSRSIVYLFYYEDLTVKQISKALSINENTVKTKLFRAREKLAIILKPDDNY
ncbi:MAG: sigma-70 family RNA polymerase sigma factor [Clostridia bacterium]|nr:sigma-70 family RNA polymerase sigma factor [Clostridia bacterium]